MAKPLSCSQMTIKTFSSHFKNIFKDSLPLFYFINKMLPQEPPRHKNCISSMFAFPLVVILFQLHVWGCWLVERVPVLAPRQTLLMGLFVALWHLLCHIHCRYRLVYCSIKRSSSLWVGPLGVNTAWCTQCMPGCHFDPDHWEIKYQYHVVYIFHM